MWAAVMKHRIVAANVCKVQQMLKCAAEEELYISLCCQRRICTELLQMQNLDKGFVQVVAPCKYNLAALQAWKLFCLGCFFPSRTFVIL